ncbi:polymorphic toxin-type HINT domain-containing protein [Chitinimonas koreensis]|uniref:polymorphic toxin-type HINT domain-containing protein n=1 Tax=Chitinimonas koreensis TaxID=356302 RepID=UPI00146FA669|nr:polymorphic toxin-type HINT domain-containing protein [Chitinimonas koreensis]QNM98751.1 hypothetical protein H9L41_11350 [Chitinimonas koreensis]
MQDVLVDFYEHRLQGKGVAGFVKGTLVHVDKGLVPIEQIKIGDMVLSRPESGDGPQAYKRVLNIGMTRGREIYSLMHCNESGDFNYLFTTADHLFWVQDIGWTELRRVEQGQILFLANGSSVYTIERWPVLEATTEDCTVEEGVGFVITNSDFSNAMGHRVRFAEKPVRINEMEYNDAMYVADRFTRDVYNLAVEDFHTYYVGEMGVWVHNSNYLGESCGQ